MLTIKQMSAAIKRECDKHPTCLSGEYPCPLYHKTTNCYSIDCTPEEIVENYNRCYSKNPYWDNITAIANRQREKGIRDYGQGIEDNKAAIIDRITHIEEELVDALMYLEWLKSGVDQHEPHE